MKEIYSQQQKAVKLSDKAIMSVIELMQDGFFQLDKDWNIVFVNKSLERISGTKREDILGKNFWEIFPAASDSNLRFWSTYHEVAEKRIPLFFEEYYPPLDVWREISAYPIEEDGIAVVLRDITERKR